MEQLHICVQKFHAHPLAHADIHETIRSNTFSRAIFLKSVLWAPQDTITISFFPIEEDMRPQWYPLSLVQPVLTSQQMDIEHRARAAPSYEAAVKMVVQEIVIPTVPTLNLSFVDGGGMVRVRFNKMGGSSSLVGKSCLTANPDDFTLTFGWMDVGTIIHEFTHVLGALHEHQSPYGGIPWNRAAVYTWARETQGWDKETTDVNILNAYPSNEITGSVFDPKSVMLYFFPPELTLNHKGTKQNLRYSDTDRQWLAQTYHAPPPASNSPTPFHISLWIIVAIAIAILVVVIFLSVS